jgi:3'-phosphoadenosine 5'-phosphosulfate sulfotransferase
VVAADAGTAELSHRTPYLPFSVFLKKKHWIRRARSQNSGMQTQIESAVESTAEKRLREIDREVHSLVGQRDTAEKEITYLRSRLWDCHWRLDRLLKERVELRKGMGLDA